jgi:hypothetical protein
VRAKMSEDEKEKKDRQMITVRIPPDLLKAYDKTNPPGGRTEDICAMMQEKLEKSGSQIKTTVSLPKLQSRADKCRREMERLRRVMVTNNKFESVETLALKFAPLNSENIPLIIQELSGYSIKPTDMFDRGDLEDYILLLEAKHKHENLLQEIDNYRKANAEPATSDITKHPNNIEKGNSKKKRYISPRDLCGCGYYETKEEHNRRCFYLYDMTHRIGFNRYLNIPVKELKMINEYGIWHDTSAEEKNMIVEYLKVHGTTAQKVMINNYFFYRLFPVPFPECDTYYDGKLVKEDLTCEKIRSLILTQRDIKRTEKESRDNRLKSRFRNLPPLDSLSDAQVAIKTEWGWMYTEEAQKKMRDHLPVEMIDLITNDRHAWMHLDEEQVKILDAYLKANNLPEPKFEGRGRYYTRNWKREPSLNSHWETVDGRRAKVWTMQGETKVWELEPWEEEDEPEANGLGFNRSGPIEPELMRKLNRAKHHIYDEPEEEESEEDHEAMSGEDELEDESNDDEEVELDETDDSEEA